MKEPGGDLLARFRAGDSSAFGELVEAMGPRLKGFYLRMGATEAIAEDLVQEVFLRVLQRSGRYRPAGRLDAYLLRIARNLWVDRQRRREPASMPELVGEAVDPAPGPAEQAGTRDRAELLRRALAELEDGHREVLELAVLQELPYREVAGILGIPVGTVKSRVFYALRRLRARLEALAPGEGPVGSPGGREGA